MEIVLDGKPDRDAVLAEARRILQTPPYTGDFNLHRLLGVDGVTLSHPAIVGESFHCAAGVDGREAEYRLSGDEMHLLVSGRAAERAMALPLDRLRDMTDDEASALLADESANWLTDVLLDVAARAKDPATSRPIAYGALSFEASAPSPSTT